MHPVAPLSRRTVLKQVCLLSVSAFLLDKQLSNLAVAEISLKAAALPAGILRISLADYPALQNDFGSVRVGTSRIGSDDYPLGLFAPVLINRAPGPVYHVLNASCTHAGCIVQTMNPVSRIIPCRCHGSRFNISGGVVNGPAGFPLQKYEFEIKDGKMLVQLPDLIFDIVLRPAPIQGKIELEFLAFLNLQYQVVYSRSLTQAPELVPFSTTPSGAETQTEFPGIDDYAKLYVTPKGDAGFYSVIIKTQSV